MISLFRKIRRSLLDSGKVRRYLIYAIGEIALVMIGILLALAINNWNQNRLSIDAANTSLMLLQEDLEDDLLQLQSLASANDTAISYTTQLLDQIKQIRPLDKNIVQYPFYLVQELTFQPNKNAFLSLNDAGKMAYIDATLQNDILEYYNLLEELNESESIANNYIQNMAEPFILENYSHSVRYFRGHQAIGEIYTTDDRDLPKFDPTAMINDSRLELLAVGRYLQSTRSRDYYKQVHIHGSALITKITHYLKI